MLEATVECLIAYGYAGTTTYRIAALAGVTRGAQVHHFRSKEDLVVAAVAHLAEQRARAALDGHRRFQSGSDLSADVLGFLWEAHQGGMFVATMELWAAARTDNVLASQLARVESMVNHALVNAITQLLPSLGAQQALRNAIYTAMDVLRGILVASFADREPGEVRRRWDRASVHLQPVLEQAIREER
ncbi:TetR/AcrR family transcriptional regulator [Mycobacterium pinniadriaticum]|uniref:Helix-turn-helix domain containing protein n=1 Tax=Mycobacterium pinniadriaticum TaxID=2994102 RepID=A0ABT3SIJ3_9MYCO|nr:TetR/AcrR family transcriptional regulator [Mycobacterium pinniadriaticum]MCX2939192.1 helix-turn-helix domain containing protein [Mycobacterium pinniadriaticum]